MAKLSLIKPTHKAIQQYYASLQSYREHQVTHEGALETAFQRLLEETAKAHSWKLIPKQKLKVGKRTLFPDGTLRDLFNMRCGFWEAKDTDDDLDAEIQKKIATGYPLSNTIFEDTRQAVLFQGGQERYRFNLTDKKQLASLLNEFYAWTEPEIDNFHQAVEEFKAQVPELAKSLLQIIEEAHKKNKKFQAAFDVFFALCQTTLNPNISREAVDEMLVQHLLTERLFRRIFDNPEFTRRNVIAVELEKVIDALVNQSFNRDSFLRSLERFYRAIEEAARGLEDFSEKQQFLNTVYERFFQGYSVKIADTHGIVYTPQEIVDFMCASVAEVLEKEFGLTLGSSGVNILDPCTGTGNFIVNLLRRIPKRDLPRVYREQLFANEVMLLPYYIAALNIEHAYYELTGNYEGFEGLCFVDTLGLEDGKDLLSFMTEKNTERVERQKKTPITVIIGNPPYNTRQLDENLNNKNRVYPVIDRRIRDLYAKDSSATLKNQLYDPYVRFFRWAIDRLGERDGVVCFVTNNSFVDQVAFDGMRRHLLREFSQLYHIDLQGNVRHNPKLSGSAYNVFGIQVGVGITVAIKKRSIAGHAIVYHAVPLEIRRDEKLTLLNQMGSVSHVEWTGLRPDAKGNWLRTESAEEFSDFLPIGSKKAKSVAISVEGVIFGAFSGGIKSNRDDTVYDFGQKTLLQRIESFVDTYNSEVDRYRRTKNPPPIDQFVNYDKLKWDGTLKAHLLRGKYLSFDAKFSREALYRPFTKRHLYFDRLAINSVYLQRLIFPGQESERENCAFCATGIGAERPFAVMPTRAIPDLNFFGPGTVPQWYPFYIYDEDGSNRRENITDSALEQFREHYGDKKISKWDIFYYVYGVLHHPGYREKFADNLKRELPRIPFAPDFRAFAIAGKELARLHLDYEELEPYALEWMETPGVPLSYRVEDKMRLSKDKTRLTVNPSLTLAGIPPETFAYRLGNRSALEWVIDQYQVSEDKRSGIKSDPNRADDEEYIVRLVGQVVFVSLETVRIVTGLPEEYGVGVP